MIFFCVIQEVNTNTERQILQELYVLKNKQKKIKNIFTYVLKGHIAVASAI